MTITRQLFSSGSSFESAVGYSRAVRVRPLVFVSGTTSSAPDGPVGGADAGAQAEEVLRRIVAALAEAGATPADVVLGGAWPA
jgi:enamine deaminase RidA (YjgF/YER057c/UK114 family)